uniref:tryptophan synthase n=1 Tax=Albugo laibachii Nc14 TaxID=890382 RepID=F0WU61_9STRA|nr:tryptophan synthase putative [Albugo laibachii Nc14]|eukprot:CCA24939.1 tryptophan synthase putative [Albugo laibachii Nc14]
MSRLSIEESFRKAKKEQRTVFIAFTCCGFVDAEDTVDVLLALEEGGTKIIELGIPFSDPQADGPTIQRAHQRGVDQKISLKDVLSTVRAAREKGLKVPVVLMGYYNNFLQYDRDTTLCKDVSEAGADGFIIVDLPPEEAVGLSKCAKENGLSYIPLISPTTSDERIGVINSIAHGFIYCVSLNGVTGERKELAPDLHEFITRIRDRVSEPLALGFGLSTREHFLEAGKTADAVVMGSRIIQAIESAEPANTLGRAEAVRQFCTSITQP